MKSVQLNILDTEDDTVLELLVYASTYWGSARILCRWVDAATRAPLDDVGTWNDWSHSFAFQNADFNSLDSLITAIANAYSGWVHAHYKVTGEVPI